MKSGIVKLQISFLVTCLTASIICTAVVNYPAFNEYFFVKTHCCPIPKLPYFYCLGIFLFIGLLIPILVGLEKQWFDICPQGRRSSLNGFASIIFLAFPFYYLFVQFISNSFFGYSDLLVPLLVSFALFILTRRFKFALTLLLLGICWFLPNHLSVFYFLPQFVSSDYRIWFLMFGIFTGYWLLTPPDLAAKATKQSKSGSRSRLPCPRPHRTHRASFPAIRSSLSERPLERTRFRY